MVAMLAPLLALAMFAQKANAVPQNELDSTLYHNCKADVRMMDSPTGGAHEDMDPAEACIDYVSGFWYGYSVRGGICNANDASRGTVIRIYVAFMETHPKLFDEDRGLGLWGALVDAYPCPSAR